jgi:hypothetical protein
MARSSYVYVLLGPDGPPMPWTVKHELRTWLQRNMPGEIHPSWRLFRCRDGRPEDAMTTMDIRAVRDEDLRSPRSCDNNFQTRGCLT